MNPLKTSGYFKTWVFYILSTTVVGFFVGAAAGFAIGFFLGVMKIQLSPLQVQLLIGAGSFLVGLPFSFLLFHHFVGRMIERKFGPWTGAPPTATMPPPVQPPPANW